MNYNNLIIFPLLENFRKILEKFLFLCKNKFARNSVERSKEMRQGSSAG